MRKVLVLRDQCGLHHQNVWSSSSHTVQRRLPYYGRLQDRPSPLAIWWPGLTDGGWLAVPVTWPYICTAVPVLRYGVHPYVIVPQCVRLCLLLLFIFVFSGVFVVKYAILGNIVCFLKWGFCWKNGARVQETSEVGCGQTRAGSRDYVQVLILSNQMYCQYANGRNISMTLKWY